MVSVEFSLPWPAYRDSLASHGVFKDKRMLSRIVLIVLLTLAGGMATGCSPGRVRMAPNLDAIERATVVEVVTSGPVIFTNSYGVVPEWTDDLAYHEALSASWRAISDQFASALQVVLPRHKVVAMPSGLTFPDIPKAGEEDPNRVWLVVQTFVLTHANGAVTICERPPVRILPAGDSDPMGHIVGGYWVAEPGSDGWQRRDWAGTMIEYPLAVLAESRGVSSGIIDLDAFVAATSNWAQTRGAEVASGLAAALRVHRSRPPSADQ
jgi:hypothetical protein